MQGLGRDRWGVPHLRAGSAVEVAWLQGYAAAVDRTWQLEVLRRRAEGLWAALVGPAGLPWDRLARRAEVASLARRCHDALGEETRDFVTAYAEGVNAGLGSAVRPPELVALDASAGAWSPWTPLAVFHAQHLLFGTVGVKLWRHHTALALGTEGAALLHHEGLGATGSNAWAVGGARTRSGYPLVGGDPHRILERPGVYAQVRLTCPDFDVAGLAFPGVPGVPHFGHAGSVAWAVTNATADYQDLYAERLERRDGQVWAEGPGGMAMARSHVEPVPVRGGPDAEVEVVVTARGPVVLDGPAPGVADGAGARGGEAARPGPHSLSLRTPSWVLGDLGFATLLPLLRARSADDVEQALVDWVEPVNNLVIADSAGWVRRVVAGRVPRRADANRWGPVPAWREGHGWRGWVADLPRAEVDPQGQVVAANHRVDAAFDRIGVEFASPTRAERIGGLLAGRDDLGVEDFAAIHADVRPGPPGPLLVALRGLTGLSEGAERLCVALADWDGRRAADSTGAALYDRVRTEVARRLLQEAPFRALPARSPYGEVLAAWFVPIARVALSLDRLVAAGAPLGVELDPILRGAVEDAAGAASAAPSHTWGERHRFAPQHALEAIGSLGRVAGLAETLAVPAVGLDGDADCVLATAAVPGTGAVTKGPVARYVWDLGDRSRSRWVVPLGAAGDPRDPHHRDQLELWAAGEMVAVFPDPSDPAQPA